MKYYTIGEAATKFNLSESALRYYEKKGLLPLIERDEAGRRLFSERQMGLLQAVICLKNSHMPISSIKQYMEWVVEGDATTRQRLDMMEIHKQKMLEEISMMTEYLQGIDEKIDRYKKYIEEEQS